MEKLPSKISLKSLKVRDTKWKHDKKPYLQLPMRSKMLASSEAHLLYDVAKRLKQGIYINLGVGNGYSTGCLAFGLKANGHSGTVYGIDLFTYRGIPYQLDYITSELEKAGLDNVSLIKGFTYESIDKISASEFNFVFIDADHYYESCKLDFESYGSRVKIGGELAFHDCHTVTVNRVIEELDPNQWKLIDHVYVTKLFKRLN
jgi:predicted O-methyltransferase YrrM